MNVKCQQDGVWVRLDPNLCSPEIRMNKGTECENPGLDSQLELTDPERNGPDSNQQTQSSKVPSFSSSPASSNFSTKFKTEEANDSPQAPTQTPQQQQSHLPQAQLMLASSQLAGCLTGRLEKTYICSLPRTKL
ncbi:POU domain, class 2, transcription factor 2-like [Heterodontus francisci]|uniref:POU domain, class 2, transcription factor 2-like n=1 Tax=Heterodontus francisci TaxID=7792 RepID=UPI00355C728C